MKILIAGDTILKNKDFVIDPKLIKLFEQHEIRCLNLEAPVTDLKECFPIKKTGPSHKNNKLALDLLLSRLKINLVTMANNHIYDFGQAGLDSTLKYLKENEIACIGNKIQGVNNYYLINEREKFVIFNMGLCEWSSYSANGGVELNLSILIEKISELKKDKMILIVILHMGIEGCTEISNYEKNIYKILDSLDVDLIVTHHSHVNNSKNDTKSRKLSIGNFIFQKNEKINSWNNGALISIEIKNGILNSRRYNVSYNNKLLHLTEGETHPKIIDKKIKKIEYIHPLSNFLNIKITKFIFRYLFKHINLDYKRRLFHIISHPIHRELLLEELKNEIFKN